jgi:hypothetical protein
MRHSGFISGLSTLDRVLKSKLRRSPVQPRRARGFFDSASKHSYEIYMTSSIPVSARSGRSRNGTGAARFRKALLRTRRTASTFEFAYQTRIAVDRIRFAIRQTDQFAANQPVLQEVGMQLLDALDRLETAERHFQECFRFDPSIRATRLNTSGTQEIHRQNSRAE